MKSSGASIVVLQSFDLGDFGGRLEAVGGQRHIRLDVRCKTVYNLLAGRTQIILGYYYLYIKA